MSDHSNPASSELFTPEEQRQFEADDSQAGKVIGKMLVLFFVYTIVAMSLCVVLTARWISVAGQ